MIPVGDVAVEADGFAPEAIATILARRQAALEPDAADPRPRLAVLACEIGGERFGFTITDIWGVVAAPAVAFVPDAPTAMIGLFQRRGVVHNLFDASAVLGASATSSGRHVLILRHVAPRLALGIDAALGIVELTGIERSEDRLVTLVDDRAHGRLGLVATDLLVSGLTAASISPEG